MKRALQATGIFVIGIDRHEITTTGTREEHTTYIADYEACKGDIETLIVHALHLFGFKPHQVLMISFDADCTTRSIMTINMNKKYRNALSGHAGIRKPGGHDALHRDIIDTKLMRWIDSISESHSDDEIVARATRWYTYTKTPSSSLPPLLDGIHGTTPSLLLRDANDARLFAKHSHSDIYHDLLTGDILHCIFSCLIGSEYDLWVRTNNDQISFLTSHWVID